jgi:curved DNA-binding protein CbpA
MNIYVDPYAALGVARGAAQDEIKQAYFKLVRQHSPERDPEGFKAIRVAFERINTPEQRVEADMRLLQTVPAPARWPEPPPLDLRVHREDLIALARAASDVERTNFRDAFRKVKL